MKEFLIELIMFCLKIDNIQVAEKYGKCFE